MSMQATRPDWIRSVGVTQRFQAMALGETWAIPVDEQTSTWASFKVYVSNHNRKLAPKRFQSRKCPDGTFEVYRSA